MELLRYLLDDDLPEPDPYLIASQTVTAADLMRSAYRCGWLPDVPYLTVAVPKTQ